MLHAMPSDGILKFRLTVKGVGSLSDGISCTEAAMRDIDSDGHPDIVVADGGRRLIVYRNLTGRTNMLRSVTLPFGGHIHISYEQTTPSYDLPGRRWVMSSVETMGDTRRTEQYEARIPSNTAVAIVTVVSVTSMVSSRYVPIR